MTVWIVLCAAFLPALVFFTVTNLANLRGLRRLDARGRPEVGGLVSVVVPARNEEAGIERCVRSLLGQAGVACELIVVNDGSTDRTGEILRRIADEDPRLRVIDGVPLPKGWLGKNWACWQGYLVSKGDIVLFTDADTAHGPRAVSRAASALVARDAGLLSLLVRQETGSFGVKLLVPVLFWLACSLFPFALLNRDSRLPLHFGNGQFMMFRREAYEAVGGHAAIRGNVFEDMTLARRVRGSGRRVVVGDGSRDVSCRMYDTLPQAFSGLAKNIYMLFHHSLPRGVAAPAYLLGLAGFALVMFGPLASLCIDAGLAIAGFPLSLPVIGLSVAGVALAVLSLGIVTRRFRFPAVMVILYPLTMVLFLAAALGSLVLTRRGRTVWKGRALPQVS